jgi:RNA polymerase sigma-70 factor (ECF subfamily)
VKAWRKIGTFRSDAKFSTWLFGIACNEWRMHARRRKELALEELAEPSAGLAEAEAATASNLRLDLAAAMKLLTTAERAAIVLCCQNGLSHDEAAQALGCPLGTVKTNVLRGREKLKRALAV